MKINHCLSFVLVTLCLSATAQDTTKYQVGEPAVNKTMKHEQSEIYSPEPKTVSPGKTASDAPSDAVILFNGANLDQWRSVNDTTRPADWNLHDNVMTVNKKAGNIETRLRFMDYQLHLEYLEPADIEGQGQFRGNSGLFLASTGGGDDGYEIQILDNYNNKTYVNGQAASIYKQSPPLVNACKKPGEWQSYDIVWAAPRFNGDGSLISPAHITAFHNGVLVQNNFILKGKTLYVGYPYYSKHGPSPIKLQAHGDASQPISFRNIWVRDL